MEPSETNLKNQLAVVLRSDPLTWDALRRARDLGLPDWWITSGAIYQSLWNAQTGKPSGYGVKDVDLIYFDGSDLSYDAEDAVIRRATPIFAGISTPVEIRNQARVHVWYPDRFGQAYPQLASAAESLLYYASRTHAVAARLLAHDVIDIVAPFGLTDIFARRIVPNFALDNRSTHEAKAARAAACWPGVEVVPWSADHVG
ncbi:MAG: nucleotidyltransferase family protein [Neomegalonema sp.]|nr:nucleotidyltransferase family protein [Neomegalonema sp.]